MVSRKYYICVSITMLSQSLPVMAMESGAKYGALAGLMATQSIDSGSRIGAGVKLVHPNGGVSQ
jgi:hypothetical protein